MIFIFVENVSNSAIHLKKTISIIKFKKFKILLKNLTDLIVEMNHDYIHHRQE